MSALRASKAIAEHQARPVQPSILHTLFANRSAARLDTASSLESLVLADKLGGGDVVILEYAETLSRHDPKLYLTAKDKSGKDCILM